jgi:hypothetical protein
MTPVRREGESRLYELRLPRIADARVRDRLVNVLVRQLPAHEVLSVARALNESGFVARVQLGEREASALLRELYAAGAEPAGVVLRPTDVVAHGRPGEADVAFGVFAERRGRFVPTWNWRAFVFGPLWYLRKGLYGKGLVLLALSVCPVWTLPITLLISPVVLVYCGVAGNWDHYLWKVERTQWW